MPKASKSSATSGTRKKHSRKAAAEAGAHIAIAKPPGKKNKKNEPPRQKRYIPPTKPAAPRPDPLDTTGLASILPSELVVPLRLLGKKDQTSKQRGLQDLQADWIDKAIGGKEEHAYVVDPLVRMLPVWFHHFPSLSIHPARRIRALTASLHASLLRIPSIGGQVLLHLQQILDPTECEAILGAWCMSAFDIDPLVAQRSRVPWGNATTWDTSPEAGLMKVPLLPNIQAIEAFIQRAVTEPIVLFRSFYPLHVTHPPTHGQKNKSMAAPALSAETGETPGPQIDHREESENDCAARLRFGALGAISWVLDTMPYAENVDTENSSPRPFADLLPTILPDPLFWSILYYGTYPPFLPGDDETVEGYGFGQPALRSTAWRLLLSLTGPAASLFKPYLPVASRAVLRSAWVETDALVRSAMWDPLLTFLTKNPSAWILEAQPLQNTEQDSSDDENQDDPAQETLATLPNASPAYAEFLDFLKLGCGGSPTEGYPTVIVVLSTLPDAIRPRSQESLRELFASFWGAVDSRALGSLDRQTTLLAFLSSFSESLFFMAKKLWQERSAADHSGKEGRGAIQELIMEQVEALWTEYTTDQLRLDASTAGPIIAKLFLRCSDLDQGLLESAWSPTSRIIANDIKMLHAIGLAIPQDNILKSHIRQLILGRTGEYVRCICQSPSDHTPNSSPLSAGQAAGYLSEAMTSFSHLLHSDVTVLSDVDTLFSGDLRGLLNLLSTTPFVTLLSSYLLHRGDAPVLHSVWKNVLSLMSSAELDLALAVLDLGKQGDLPAHLKLDGDGLKDLAKHTIDSVLRGEGPPSKLDGIRFLQLVMEQHGQFVDQATVLEVLERCGSAITNAVHLLVQFSDVDLTALDGSLTLWARIASNQSVTSLRGHTMVPLSDIFILAFVLPKEPGSDSILARCSELSKSIWEQSTFQFPVQSRDALYLELRQRLQDLLGDVTVRLTPSTVLPALKSAAEFGGNSLTLEVVISRALLDLQYDQIAIDPIEGSLEVFIPLKPTDSASPAVTYDNHALASYSRLVWGLLEFLEEDRQLGRENNWILPHLIIFGALGADHLSVPSLGNPAFGPMANPQLVHSLVQKAQQCVTYFLSSLFSDLPSAWHASITSSLKDAKSPQLGAASHTSLLQHVYRAAVSTGCLRDLRVLKAVLESLLKDAGPQEADQWLGIAIGNTSPSVTFVVISTITSLGLDPPRLERFRNELASRISGITPSKANAQGLELLQLLLATTPPLESEVIFLPQQRAVFLLQNLQKWIASDEDLDEQLDGLLVYLFAHLVPILQNVPGAHWDLIFDLIESNMESSSFKEDSTLVRISGSANLILKVDEVASSNKSLLEIWRARKQEILRLVGALLLVRVDDMPRSVPRDECRKLVMRVARDLSINLDEREGLPMLCSLLRDPAIEVKTSAYQLLQNIVKLRTERFVLEAAIESQSGEGHMLPEELLPLLYGLSAKNMQDEEIAGTSYITGLLAWMVVFDLFTDVSLKLRNEYLEHLRNLELVGSHFLPAIFSLLQIGEGTRNPKMDIWAVDEFHVSLMDDSLGCLPEVFAEHVYFRALKTIPSLVRDWWLACKDRQLSNAVAKATTRYFSPILIEGELARLRQPEATAELQDETFSAKILPSANEVSATYLVDDQKMEISIKLPQDFPLHPVEVNDIQRVAVAETTWRGWLLNVQQISQGGMILEALSLFKKNATLHFEGISECAICYSIVSVTDRSMPKKPCKTCKNRFHAACLYKWINTSHSSTCPLCRSEML